ncbi:Outer membrane protein OmpA [Cognatiyoonia koreensis]|uniref:Outer membrane protein OmpA n=1 Tax=Cognatiyoonia koreensis TaxID=364200 RepID=A0A1I0QVG6_9RHOB|nr:OmpA family protein [Cognatiyoonia koreensis]SEW31473.1 Outer membrane protein OmpA [Cognatiyoonia koreensis]
MTLTKISLGLAAVAFVAACDGTRPNNNQNAEQGALIGAGVGALAGVISGDSVDERRRNAVLGAAIGAAGGAAIGNQLDRQEEELRRSLGGNVGIVNNGNNLVVTLPQDILFATNSTSVSGSAQADLRTLAASMNQYPNTTVNVIGHTDNVGDASFNFDLSQRRAQAVSSVLINAGVNPSRIRSVGRGEDAPVATNLTADGRQQNRRVEIVITPN